VEIIATRALRDPLYLDFRTGDPIKAGKGSPPAIHFEERKLTRPEMTPVLLTELSGPEVVIVPDRLRARFAWGASRTGRNGLAARPNFQAAERLPASYFETVTRVLVPEALSALRDPFAPRIAKRAEDQGAEFSLSLSPRNSVSFPDGTGEMGVGTKRAAVNAGTLFDGGRGSLMGAEEGGRTPTSAKADFPPTGDDDDRIIRPVLSDFVLTSAQLTIPGTLGLLAGRPIFTVYIPMRTAKDWILQFSLGPDQAKPSRNGYIVSLTPVPEIVAPYAYVMYRPPVRVWPGVRYAFIHGWITDKGRFEGLAEAGGKSLMEPGPFLESLRKWEFRPALRDSSPVRVEVLLCIPAR
jgi:hypothetical protein